MKPLFASLLLVFLGCGSTAVEDPAASSDSGATIQPDATPESGELDAAIEAASSDGDVPASDAPPTPVGDPISVPASELEKWVYVPIEGMRCGDGSASGVGVNFTSKSRKVLLWFQGNGVCYDALTCNLYKGLLVGLGSDPIKQMFWGNAGAGGVGVFDRGDPNNPFRDSSFIVFPHCTVDAHTADKDSEYAGVGKVYQHGYANVTVALGRIVPTFVDATQIVVAGFSAGGIGATANYHQIATRFRPYNPNLPFLVNDSGPILQVPYLSKGATDKLRKGWGLDATVGSYCPSCMSNGVGEVYRVLAQLHPGLRSSQLSSYADNVTGSLYKLLNSDTSALDGGWLKKGLLAHEAWSAQYSVDLAPSTHRTFYFEGTGHGTVPGSPMVPGAAAFLNAQLSGEPAWASVSP